MAGPPCAEHRNMIETNEKRIDKLDVVVEKLRSHLPIWVTVAFSGATLLIGWLLCYIKKF